MIRVRRRLSRLPFSRLYEVEIIPAGRVDLSEKHLTRAPNRVLEPILGLADAWSFVREADRQWERGNREWAVEFEEGNGAG